MNITETETYELEIYQIELTDPVIGGEDGIANLQAKQLANRTNWLKVAYEKIVDGTTSIAKALKLATARKISLGGILSGYENFDGSADITINATIADNALTIAKTNGLQAALDSKMESIGSASTTARGIIEIATNAEVAAGTDLSRAVTPAGLYNALSALAILAGFVFYFGTNGYIKFPSYLGSIIFQWGINSNGTASPTTPTVVILPIAFPNAIFIAVANRFGSANENGTVSPSSLANIQIFATITNSSVSWIAIGY